MKTVAPDCGQKRQCPLREACSPGRFLPCIDMKRAHDQKLKLCDALETIADDLPSRVDRLQCLVVASTLVPVLNACHRFEEERIFPAIVGKLGGEALVSRLKVEHVEDDCAAADISEVLLGYGHGREIDNPEALGYMLRALFGAMRRHIAFERDLILPQIPFAC